jgi:ribosome-associated toxin RatA of RatAB toxin-antitoxin module
VTWVVYNGSQGYTISPNTGAHIDSVLVDGVNQGVQTTWNFTNVTTNHTIDGYFSLDTFSITATAYGPGSVTPAGVTWVAYNGSQSYTISPNTGAHIDSVLVDGVNQGVITSYPFNNVTANHTIDGYFSLDTFSITATAYGPGTVTPAGVTWVAYNGSQGYTISPNTGAHIDSVLIDGVNQGVQTTWNFTNVTTNHTIDGYFSVDSFSITATAYGPGSVTPAGVTWVVYNGSQGYTISPNTGAHIDSVLIDGVNQGVQTTWNFTNVTTNHTIDGYFSLDTFSITATAYGPGSVTPAGVTWVVYNGSQGYTISPNTGAHIDSVLIDGVNQGVQTTWNFTNVTANHTIAGYFSLDTFKITATAYGSGVVNPPGITWVTYNGSQSYTIIPNSGQSIDSVLVDGVNQGVQTTWNFTNVTADHTIDGYFTSLAYHDVGIPSIPVPGTSVPVCTPFNPVIEVFNYTTPSMVELCTVYVRIWRHPVKIDSLCHISANLAESILVYFDSVITYVNPGSNNVQFPSWHPTWTDLTWLSSPTYHIIHANVEMSSDTNPANDNYNKQFNVTGINYDLQVNGVALLRGSSIVGEDTIRTGTSYNTMSVVSNNSPTARISLRSWFKIIRVATNQIVYSRYLDRTLFPGTYACIYYSSGWVPQDTGWYLMSSWIETRPGQDVTPGNNSFEKYYYATYLTSENIQGNAITPETYALFSNYPNPFADITQIRWQIPVSTRVTISVYDATGRMIKSLVNGEHNAGTYTSSWNRTDERGQKVAAGVYFYELRTEKFTQRNKMILTQ